MSEEQTRQEQPPQTPPQEPASSAIPMEQLTSLVQEQVAQAIAVLKEEFASQQAQDGGEGNAEDDGGEKPPALDEELADAKKALQEFLETELEKLNEQERELVAELGGEDPAQQLRVLARLRKAGKIGQQAQAQARTTAPLTNGREAPKTWEDATRALAQRLRGRI